MAMDSALVARESFTQLMLMGCEAREEWNENDKSGGRRPQKVNREGVPVWRLQVAATTWRGRGEMLSVTVPYQTDPMEALGAGAPVEFAALTMGVSPKKNGGFSVWFSADAVRVVDGAAARPRPLAAVAES